MSMQREKEMALRLVHNNSTNVASRTVELVAEARLPTETGEFRIIGFRSLVSAEEFVVLVKGELRPDRSSLVRIHSQCMTGDVFGSRSEERRVGKECRSRWSA